MSRLKVHTGQGDGIGAGLYYKASPQAKIDPESEESLAHWEQSLQLSRDELLSAIQKYGTGVRDIRRGLINETPDKAA
jgi:hypothetical protein